MGLQQIVIVFVFVELTSFGIAVRKKNITKYIYILYVLGHSSIALTKQRQRTPLVAEKVRVLKHVLLT